MTTPLNFSQFPYHIVSTANLQPGYVELRRYPSVGQISSRCTKNVWILHKPFGRDSLFFHDQDLRLIRNANDLMAATSVMVLNDICIDGKFAGNVMSKYDDVPVYVENFLKPLKIVTFQTETGDIEVESQYDLISRAFPEKDAIKQITFS